MGNLWWIPITLWMDSTVLPMPAQTCMVCGLGNLSRHVFSHPLSLSDSQCLSPEAQNDRDSHPFVISRYVIVHLLMCVCVCVYVYICLCQDLAVAYKIFDLYLWQVGSSPLSRD